MACKVANQPFLKASFRALLMMGSTEFYASIKPSSYHLLSQPSRAAFKSTNSSARMVFRLAALANFSSVSPNLASSSDYLFSTDTLAFSDTTTFFFTVGVALAFSLLVTSTMSFRALSRSASSASSLTRPLRMCVSWAAWQTSNDNHKYKDSIHVKNQ